MAIQEGELIYIRKPFEDTFPGNYVIQTTFASAEKPTDKHICFVEGIEGAFDEAYIKKTKDETAQLDDGKE